MLFELRSRSFGIEAGVIREFVQLGPAHAIARAPREVRGLVALRDRTIPVVDLRAAIGMQSHVEELDELSLELAKRKEDHVRWIAELTACIHERRAFGLATDPTKCAFGRWYGGFQADDPVVKLKLLAIDRPHRRIHALANETLALAESGRQREAIARIDDAREGDLAVVKRLLDELAVLIRGAAREVLLVCDLGARPFGIAVDAVHEVRPIAREELCAPTSGSLATDDDVLAGAVATERGLAMLLRIERLVERVLGGRYVGAACHRGSVESAGQRAPAS